MKRDFPFPVFAMAYGRDDQSKIDRLFIPTSMGLSEWIWATIRSVSWSGRSAVLPQPLTTAAHGIRRLVASEAQSSSAFDRRRWPGCPPGTSSSNVRQHRRVHPWDAKDNRVVGRGQNQKRWVG